MDSQEPAAGFSDISSLISLWLSISVEETLAPSRFLRTRSTEHWGGAGRLGAALEAGPGAGGWVLPQERSHKGITFLKSSCLTFLNQTFLSYTFIF